MKKIKWYIVKELPYCLLHFLIEKNLLNKYVENMKAYIQWLALKKNTSISELVIKKTFFDKKIS